jgi:hypothetical protein
LALVDTAQVEPTVVLAVAPHDTENLKCVSETVMGPLLVVSVTASLSVSRRRRSAWSCPA